MKSGDIVRWDDVLHIVAHVAPGPYVTEWHRNLEASLQCAPGIYCVEAPFETKDGVATCLWCVSGRTLR